MALCHVPIVSTLIFFVAASLILSPVSCYRVTVDKKECFIQEVEAEGQMVHGSFVIVKSDNAWTTDFETVGLDLMVSAALAIHTRSSGIASQAQCHCCEVSVHCLCKSRLP